jgi:hypothetical protein
VKLTLAPPRPERPPLRINWLLWLAVAFLIAVGSGGFFIYQTLSERKALGELIAQLSTLDRLQLTERWILRRRGFFYKEKEWRHKVSWTPEPAGPPPTDRRARGFAAEPPLPRVTATTQSQIALAVTPRLDYLDFDAIYLLYDGERVVASFAQSSVGGFFDGELIEQHKHPVTLIPRQLTPGEQQRLSQMIALLEQRRDSFNPQSDQYGWTQNVLNAARRLLQGSQLSPASPAPN